jgi:hypothetical protein
LTPLQSDNKVASKTKKKANKTPVILASQEAEIRRITVRSQPGQIIQKTLSPKKIINHTHKKRTSGVAQG